MRIVVLGVWAVLVRSNLHVLVGLLKYVADGSDCDGGVLLAAEPILAHGVVEQWHSLSDYLLDLQATTCQRSLFQIHQVEDVV